MSSCQLNYLDYSYRLGVVQTMAQALMHRESNSPVQHDDESRVIFAFSFGVQCPIVRVSFPIIFSILFLRVSLPLSSSASQDLIFRIISRGIFNMGSRQRKRAAARAAASTHSTAPAVPDDMPSTSTESSPHIPSSPPPTPAPHSDGSARTNIRVDFSESYKKFAGKVDADTFQATRKLAILEGQMLLLREVTDTQKRENVLRYEKGFEEGRQVGFRDGHELGRMLILDGLPARLEDERRTGFEEGWRAAHTE
ncbi:hypothetical protein EVG20_g9739 [Dentipellis fragilis]|uniref:Uncharacterized protein n=1 Tax=Dentipellis fragilis TaxID=205917 RepID=A0A4Y9XYW3_9AGAM|nr:hypothetical protein EVG20_g9739 [Dentipellis fragilis]